MSILPAKSRQHVRPFSSPPNRSFFYFMAKRRRPCRSAGSWDAASEGDGRGFKARLHPGHRVWPDLWLCGAGGFNGGRFPLSASQIRRVKQARARSTSSLDMHELLAWYARILWSMEQWLPWAVEHGREQPMNKTAKTRSARARRTMILHYRCLLCETSSIS